MSRMEKTIHLSLEDFDKIVSAAIYYGVKSGHKNERALGPFRDLVARYASALAIKRTEATEHLDAIDP